MITNIVLTIYGISFLISIFFLLKILFKLENRISNIEKIELTNKLSDKNTENSVASGLTKGLQSIKDEDERHLKFLEMSRKIQNNPLPVMNQNFNKPISFDTNGDLIPTNLTKEEEEILKMYYDRGN